MMIKDISINKTIEVGSLIKTSSFSDFVFDAMYDFYNTNDGKVFFEKLTGGNGNE